MKLHTFLLVISVISLVSCSRIPPEISADLSLDDLVDMQEYGEGMVVATHSYEGKRVDKILVNGIETEKRDVLELKSAGYYRIDIILGKFGRTSTEVIRIVILDAERGYPEWGLPPWTPLEPVYGELGQQSPKLIYTKTAPPDLSLPLIVQLGDELRESDIYLNAEIGSQHFRIKRGVGSVQIPAGSREEAVMIDEKSYKLSITNFDTPPLLLSGELETDIQIPDGSYIHIPADLTIPEDRTLSIGEGSFITVAHAVNVINNGGLLFSGTADAPITITCSNSEAYWGGFIGTTVLNRLVASHTIFSRSGHHVGGDYDYGHAHRQALFYSENGELELDHCYMLDHIGQVFYPLSCELELRYCLIQRAKTGGQINLSELMMDHCVFSDFPDDTNIYRDEDNDGLYLDMTNAVINNSAFMFAKDDGLDSGASGGGEVLINNTIFEANFHEGAALSSGHFVTKIHRIRDCLFTNNGQGLELGYSSPNHLVDVDSCRFIGNGIGIRYGDCYDYPHRGYMHVKNSESLENKFHDVWNMNREHWAADISSLLLENVVVSMPNPDYPELILHE